MVDRVGEIRSRIEEIKGRFGSNAAADTGDAFGQALSLAQENGSADGRTSPLGQAYGSGAFQAYSSAPPALSLEGVAFQKSENSLAPLPEIPVSSGASEGASAQSVSPMPVDLTNLTLSSAYAASQAASPIAASRATTASETSDLKRIIQQASDKYGVDASLIQGVISAESNFNPNAVSSVGAQGLMQLMPETSKALGVTNAFDPAQNVNGGTQYLRHLIDKFGSVPLAVAAYNAGPSKVERYGGIPPYPETQKYVRTVMERQREYSQ